MRDLLTNIKKAIEILNKNKNLTISLTDPQTIIYDQIPIGVSRADYEESIKDAVNYLLFTADDLAINFDCTFHIDDLRVEEYNSTKYMEAMQRIIKEIYDRYKWAASIGTVGLNGSQTITGSQTYTASAYPTWAQLSNSINLGPTTTSNFNIGSDVKVNGEIEADDIKVNGGQLSVSDELDVLKKRNEALEAELVMLKVMLESKGVI